MRPAKQLVAVLVLILGLTGCPSGGSNGGGGGSAASTTASTTAAPVLEATNPLPPAETGGTSSGGGGPGAGSSSSGAGTGGPTLGAPAKVRIVQTGLMFTEVGQTRQLQAVVTDASGQTLNTPVTWRAKSTSTNAVSINGTGLAKSELANGSGQIIATVGAIESVPLLAIVTPVPVNTLLIEDSQIVRGPQLVDPNTEPAIGSRYTIIVAESVIPVIGSTVIGTGSIPVGGRVVAVQPGLGGRVVTLELIPLSELLPDLAINQVMDLKNVPLEMTPEMAQVFTMVREGSTYTFTQKNTASNKSGVQTKSEVGSKKGLMDFCEDSVITGGNTLPLVFNQPISFKVDLQPTITAGDTDTGFTYALNLAPVVQYEFKASVSAAVEFKLSCKFPLAPIPISTGPLSIFFIGELTFGLGIELGAKATAANMGFGLKGETKGAASAGYGCDTGECGVIGTIGEFTNTNEYIVDVPDFEADPRLEVGIEPFVFGDIGFKNAMLNALKLGVIETKVGVKAAGNFANKTTQMLETNYKSDYGLNFGASAKLGSDIAKPLKFIGLTKLGEIEIGVTKSIATSPVGTVTTDFSEFAVDDEVTFNVKLDPEKMEFLEIYNVKEILLVHNDGGTARVIDRQPAVFGVADFTFVHKATKPGKTKDVFAFVITKVLPTEILALELGNATTDNKPPESKDDTATVDIDSKDNAILVLANDTDPNGDELEVSEVSAAILGTTSISADRRSVLYTPNSGHTGSDSFTYTVHDGRGGFSTSSVTVDTGETGQSTEKLQLFQFDISHYSEGSTCDYREGYITAACNAGPTIRDYKHYLPYHGQTVPPYTGSSSATSPAGNYYGLNSNVQVSETKVNGELRSVTMTCLISGQTNAMEKRILHPDYTQSADRVRGMMATGEGFDLYVPREGVRISVTPMAQLSGSGHERSLSAYMSYRIYGAHGAGGNYEKTYYYYQGVPGVEEVEEGSHSGQLTSGFGKDKFSFGRTLIVTSDSVEDRPVVSGSFSGSVKIEFLP